MRALVLAATITALAATILPAQDAVEPWRHTRYELLPPHTSQFRVIYHVSATTPGQATYHNVIREGAEASDIAVFDEATGAPLPHRVVDAATARDAGLAGARDTALYIQVDLARPVPEGGEARLRIEKTYADPASYFREGAVASFDRTLSVPRNTILLPPHHELLSCSVPAQVVLEDDGRLALSIVHPMPMSMPVRVESRPMRGSTRPLVQAAFGDLGDAPVRAPMLDGRAEDSRSIVYRLQQPETGAFDLHHDLTIMREGQSSYENWVRAGSTVSSLRAWDLDTGTELHVLQLRGDEITAAGFGEGREITGDSQLVAALFEPIAPRASMRLRIAETYTDTGRYRLESDELVWHRGFGRARNAVVLPEGWSVSTCSVPARIAMDEDGRQRLELANPRGDWLDVYVRARRVVPVEAHRVDGSPLMALEVESTRQVERADNLARALAAFEASPEDESLAISAARHLAWFGRFRDAIDMYSAEIEKRPDSFRLLRHRGHRRLTVRDFDGAAQDLSLASEIIESQWASISTMELLDDDTPDQYRWSTWYHLGLAHYFRRDFAAAAEAFRRTLALSPNDDKKAAASYWLSNCLGQLGRHDEARALAEHFHPGMDIQSNLSYHELMLLMNGSRTLEETLDINDPSADRFPTLGFGVANSMLFNGDRAGAVALYRRIVASTDWLGFGHVGSEAELLALGEELP